MIPPTYAFSPLIPAAAVTALKRKTVEDKQLLEALAAVDYPKSDVIPRAETLTPAQRAVVDVITEFGFRTYGPGLKTMVPDNTPDRRRWLGFDPPGPLERLVKFGAGKEPIWRALALSKSNEAAFTKTFPLKEQLELWGEVYLTFPNPWGIDEWLFLGNNVNYPSLATLKSEGRDWAPKYADALRESKARSSAGPLPLFLSLVRAKVPIAPRWDQLLPLGTPTDNLQKLVTAAKGHPEVLALFEEGDKDTPKLTEMQSTRANGEFSAAAKKQIVVAAQRYSGSKLAFAAALAQLELIEYRAVANAKGKHVYDLWLYAGDSGTVFTAGTSKVVAEIVQRKVEGKDKALNRALENVIRAPAKKKAKKKR